MTQGEYRVGFKPTVLDYTITALAVVSIVLYVTFLPGNHPDSAARYNLSESEIIEKANIYLATQGYSTEDLIIEAELARQSTLLADLQDDLGRREAFDVIRSEDGGVLPVYYWRVRYDILDPDSSEDDLLPSSSTVFTVRLTQDGSVWSFLNTTSRIGSSAGLLGSARTSVNRSALANAIRPADSTIRSTLNALRTVPDSLLLANLRFDRNTSSSLSSGADLSSDDSVLEGGASVFLRMIEGRYLRLTEEVLLSLARYHAPDVLPGGAEWKVDSVQVLPARNDQLARVRLSSASAVHQQEVRADITVSSVGSVRSMDVSYNPDRSRSTDEEQMIGIILVAIYIVFGLVLIIVFFRRVMARLVDIKSALLDGIIIGSFFAVHIVLSKQNFDFGHAPLWVSIGLRLLIFSGIAGAMTLLTFMFSAVSESMSRDVWPKKSLTLTLLRRGELRNTVVGSSLLRGIALAAILLGLSMLFLTLLPDVSLRTGPDLLTGTSRRPLVYEASGSASQVYLVTVIILLGLGTFVKRLGGHTVLVVLVITLVGGVLQFAPIGVELGWYSFGLSAASALVICLFFVKYDFLTAFTGMAVAQFVWTMTEGFIVSGSPAWIDAYLGGVGVLGIIGIGFVGAFSRRSGRELGEFVPDYIIEMTGQERIKRELEIAHQVQASFLPRTMPSVVGIDLAGMCLPANEVGGDYFDFIELSDHRLAFVVGDVSGKGTQAAFYMTLVKGMIQTLAELDCSPAEVMCRLNVLFRRNAPAGTFISLIYGVVDVPSGVFTFARAGHNPAIIKRKGESSASALQPRGMAIGFAGADVFDNNIEQLSVSLKTGDAMVFYTDGFSEAMNSARELYSDERLVEKLSHVGDRSAGAILRSMTEAVHHFIEGAGRSDDMTMVVLKMKADT